MIRRNKKLINKLLIIISVFAFVACSNDEVDKKDEPGVVTLDSDQNETEQAEKEEVSLNELKSFLFEKLDGQKVIRNYGEDTAWTDIIFSADGAFKGTYMGKYQNDGFDGGMREFAENVYLGEEIHLSDFNGNFEITEQINDYVYKMKLTDFEISSEYGAHDAIYFNVDFALGMNPYAEYYLYIPGTPKSYLPNADTKLDSNYKLEDYKEDKTQGFIIWNKTDDEVFNQFRAEYDAKDFN